MTIQTETTNLIGKETTQTNWIHRLGLFIVFLVCEAAIFIFGSYYFDIFPTNRNLTYNLVVSAVFLAAVVTDVGAPLSHAAIVARELGIPAVVGCRDATARLKTGDRVRVDGSAGSVEVVERTGR